MVSNQKGFTLIEAIVYMALLSILLVGGLLATYQIMIGQSQSQTHNTTQDEGGFAIRKIEWALTNIATSNSPPTTPSSGFASTLDVNTAYGRIQFCQSGTTLYMREHGTAGSCGDASYIALTTSNVKANPASLHFHYIAPVGTSPGGIEASTTIDGITFATVRYIR
jgi:prepilin-type N-terminal cleavage/methylation domain-containing protein